MKVDTYSPNTGEKLCFFALAHVVVENDRVITFMYYLGLTD